VPAWRQEGGRGGQQQEEEQQQSFAGGQGLQGQEKPVSSSTSEGSAEDDEVLSSRRTSGLGASSSSSSSSSSTSVGGSVTSQSLPPGWWRDLPRVHYANFGARLGILPRLPARSSAPGGGGTRKGEQLASRGGDEDESGQPLPAPPDVAIEQYGSSRSMPTLSLGSGALSQGMIVAFEDAVDAEYVANSLRVGMARRAGR